MRAVDLSKTLSKHNLTLVGRRCNHCNKLIRPNNTVLTQTVQNHPLDITIVFHARCIERLMVGHGTGPKEFDIIRQKILDQGVPFPT